MITNYPRPQLTIANNIRTTAAALANRFQAIAIGPQYRLNRYGKDEIPVGQTFLSAGQTLTLKYLDENGAAQNLPATNVLDTSMTKLYAENLELSLASFAVDATNRIFLDSVAEPSVIRIEDVTFKGDDLDPAFHGRDVKVGDVVYVNDGTTGLRRRTVTGFRGRTVDGSYGANTAKDDTNGGNSTYNPITHDATNGDVVVSAIPSGYTLTVTSPGSFNAKVRGSKLGTKYGEEFTLTVVTGGLPGVATFSITSASGLWATSTPVTSTDNAGDFAIASAELAGVGVNIDPGAGTTVTAGQVFTFEVYGDYTRLSDTQLDVSDTGSGYTGSKNTTYFIEVTTGTTGGTFTGAVVRITDTAGLETPTDVNVTNNTYFNVGTRGLRMRFVHTSMPAQGGLRKGDIYFIHAVAATASTTAFDRVVLDGPVSDTSVFSSLDTAIVVEFRTLHTGEIAADAAADGSAWTISGRTIVLQANLQVEVDERDSGYTWCNAVTGKGLLFPSYRALVPPVYGEDRFKITSTDDIIAQTGPIDMDNDLAFGLSEMFDGSQGRPIFGLRTAGLSVANFAEAFVKISATDDIYSLGVITEDVAVMTAAKQHAAAMSVKEVKNFRKVYVGSDSPGSYAVLKLQSDGSSTFTATITEYQEANLLATIVAGEDDTNLLLLGLADGDRFLLPGLDEEYEILEVLSENELVLKTGPVSPLSPAAECQIWKADTVASQKSFLQQRAAALNSELCVHVWYEDGTRFIDGVATQIPARFAACQMAGLRSALRVQQGLTRTEITTITAAPAMYLRYTQEDLDDIAKYGNFIITQNAPTGPVFIRHQLTTNTSKGSLYYEDNATAIIHSVDFATKDICEPYIGKKNAVEVVREKLERALTEMLRGKTLISVTDDPDLGPELVDFRDLSVELHPILKDRFVIGGTLTIPLPLNNIDVTWSAEVTV